MFYGVRKIEFVSGPGFEPIKLQADLTSRGELDLTLHFPIRRTGEWIRNNPKSRERLQALIKDGEPASLIVHPNPDVKPHLARVGWITAAYLLTFRALGYRYIFDEVLEPVRGLIRQSFSDEAKEHLEIPTSSNFRFEMSDMSVADPTIALVNAANGRQDLLYSGEFP